MDSALPDALRYAEIGWHVFPCKPDKKPLTKHGFQDASTDEAQIREWWERWPEAVIGVACLASGLAVIDLDMKHGANGVEVWEHLQDDRGGDERNLEARTPSGGRHYVYLHPGRRVKTANNIDKIRGVDVRGDGGYFVAPSAAEPDREWVVGDPFECNPDGTTDVPGMPKWLVDMVCETEPTAASSPAGGSTGGMTIPANRVVAIRDALEHVDPDPHDDWIRIGMALKSTGAGDQAFTVWTEWARRSPKFCELEHRKRWRSLREFRWDGSEVTLGSLFHMARDAGWSPSLDTEAQLDVETPDLGEFEAEAPPTARPFPAELLNVPGVLGELTEWIRDSGLREQPALALGSAIAVCGAIMGRRVATPTNLRSNVYIVGVGDTACGKEAGVSEPITLLKLANLDRFLGTSDWTSAAAIRSSLMANASQVCLIDEFGKWMKRVSGERIAPHLQGVKDMLMQAYSRASGVMLGVAYANQRDNPKADILEPNLCLYGASTPDELFGAMDHGAIQDGFLNRFLFIFVDDRLPTMRDLSLVAEGDRERAREHLFQSLREMEAATRPDGELVDVTNDGTTKSGCRIVPFSDEAHALWVEIQREADARMLEMRDRGNPMADLWVRFAAHVAKLGMIRSVADDPSKPIEAHDIRWAHALTEWCVERTAEVCGAHVADNRNEAETKRVLRTIARGKADGLTANQLTRATQWLRRGDRRDIIATLVEGGQVVRTERKTKTRAATVYVAAEFVNASTIRHAAGNDATELPTAT